MKPKLQALLTALILVLTACAPNTNQTQQGPDGSGRPGEPPAGANGPGPGGAGFPGGGGFPGGPGPGGAPGGFGGPQGAGAAKGATVLTVQAKAVTSATLTGENTTSGTVEAVGQSKVPAQVAGTVQKVLVQVGDWVKANQIIVQLDTTSSKLSLETAQASLQNAKISLDSEASTTSQDTPKLQYQLNSAQAAYDAAAKVYQADSAAYQLGGLSGSDLDTSKASLDTAQANLEAAKAALSTNQKSDDQTLATLRNQLKQAEITVAQAQLNLDNTAIRAPFDGQVASIAYQKGEYVTSSSTAFVLVSRAKQVSFSIAPADAAKLSKGSSVRFTSDVQGWNLTVAHSPSSPTNGLVPLLASSSAASLPAYGTVGTIRYTIALGTGPQVPISAIQSKNNASYVYTVEENKVAKREVTIVAENGATAVVQGLTVPTQVIVSPPPGLVIGASVKIAGGS